MIFTIFQEVVQKHQKSPNFELWEASRWSVFIGFQKNFGFGLHLPISTTYLRSDKIRNVVWPPRGGGGGLTPVIKMSKSEKYIPLSRSKKNTASAPHHWRQALSYQIQIYQHFKNNSWFLSKCLIFLWRRKNKTICFHYNFAAS